MSNEQSKTVVATQTTSATERVITIVPTRGQSKKITYDGNDWTGLKAKLESEGFDLTNIKAVEGRTKTTLEHPQALIPEGNFNLFLMPYKSKSGAKELTRGDLYGIIKKAKEKDGQKAQDHFGNHTTKSTDDLRELVNSYKPEAKKTRKDNKHEATADVVESIKNASSKKAVFKHLDGLSVDEKLDVLVGVVLDLKNSKGTVQDNQTEQAQDTAPKESEEEKAKRLAKEAQEAEDLALQNELNSLALGLSDVDTRKVVPTRRY